MADVWDGIIIGATGGAIAGLTVTFVRYVCKPARKIPSEHAHPIEGQSDCPAFSGSCRLWGVSGDNARRGPIFLLGALGIV